MSLWFLTCISNPVGLKSRPSLFYEFRRHVLDDLAIPLVVVECLYPGDEGDHYDQYTDRTDYIHITVGAKSRMWHKENLLNIGIRWLLRNRPEFKNIAWIDADITYLSPHNVKTSIEHVLLSVPICQAWHVALDSGPTPGSVLKTQYACQFTQDLSHAVLESTNQSGYAWAATRDFLEATGGLLDSCIIGGGDKAMYHGCMGMIGRSMDMTFSGGYRDAVKKWTEYALTACHGKVGYVPLVIRHGFHGYKSNRGYCQRYDVLRRHGFTPKAHLVTNADGVYEWSDRAPVGLSEDLMAYFQSRKEDGK